MEESMTKGTGADEEVGSHEYLIRLWSAQLNRPHVDEDEDFFAAGGSSMQVIEMLMTVSSRFGKELDYAEFLREPCIRKLSELLDVQS
jgi:syringomycin synthetase protein SyrB1